MFGFKVVRWCLLLFWNHHLYFGGGFWWFKTCSVGGKPILIPSLLWIQLHPHSSGISHYSRLVTCWSNSSFILFLDEILNLTAVLSRLAWASERSLGHLVNGIPKVLFIILGLGIYHVFHVGRKVGFRLLENSIFYEWLICCIWVAHNRPNLNYSLFCLDVHILHHFEIERKKYNNFEN